MTSPYIAQTSNFDPRAATRPSGNTTYSGTGHLSLDKDHAHPFAASSLPNPPSSSPSSSFIKEGGNGVSTAPWS